MSLLEALRRRCSAIALSVAAAVAAFGPQAGAAAAQSQPTRFVSDVHVVTGDSSNIACPSGYTRINQDLNQGSGGKFVYACAWYDNNPSTAIEELYVNYYFAGYSGDNPSTNSDNPHCNSDYDVVIDGNLNEGTGKGLTSSEGLNFCKHRTGTPGGSGAIAHPGQGYTEYFPARAGKALTDIGFVRFDAGSPPTCNNNACVDTGIGALSYLEVGTTVDPYCQKQFGADWHPLFARGTTGRPATRTPTSLKTPR